MAYDFKKLSEVELLSEVPDGASAFVEVNGDVKRVPGSGLGGGGVATAILRYNTDAEGQSAEGGIAVQASNPTLTSAPITCDNMTYAQAKAIWDAQQPLAMMLLRAGVWLTAVIVGLADENINAIFTTGSDVINIYWKADGFYIEQSK